MTKDKFAILKLYSEELPKFIEELFTFIPANSFLLTQKYSDFISGLIVDKYIQMVLSNYDYILFPENEIYLKEVFSDYNNSRTIQVFRLYKMLKFPDDIEDIRNFVLDCKFLFDFYYFKYSISYFVSKLQLEYEDLLNDE